MRRRLEELETLAASKGDGDNLDALALRGQDSNSALATSTSSAVSISEDPQTSLDRLELQLGLDSSDCPILLEEDIPSLPDIFTLPFASTPGLSFMPSDLFITSASSDSDDSGWHDRTLVFPAQAPGKELMLNDDEWRYVDCGCARAHLQLSMSSSMDCRENPVPGPIPPPPNDRNAFLSRICIGEAFVINSAQLGITENMLCDRDGSSHFYRSSDRPADDPLTERVVKANQAIFKSLKPDLRPVREQIIMRHNSWIDVLPFPTLRANIIKNKDGLDEDTLLRDLMQGLICWRAGGDGGGAGEGGIRGMWTDLSLVTRDAVNGTPWESRSWECRPWFLRKYWELLGGEEGDLVRQSEWWRNFKSALDARTFEVSSVV